MRFSRPLGTKLDEVVVALNKWHQAQQLQKL